MRFGPEPHSTGRPGRLDSSAAARSRRPSSSIAARTSGEPTNRNVIGRWASCAAYHSGSSVVATRRVACSSTSSSRPKLRGSQCRHSSTGASMITSTACFQPIESCSSTASSASRPAGVSNRSGSTSTPLTRSTRSTRRAPLSCDQPSTYHRRCRTTTAHGSSSMSHSRPGSWPYRRRTRSPASEACTSRRVTSTSGTTTCQPRAGTRRTASAGRARGSGRARTILPRAWPTGSSSPAGWPSSTAITRPSASVGVNISGGSRSPRPIR